MSEVVLSGSVLFFLNTKKRYLIDILQRQIQPKINQNTQISNGQLTCVIFCHGKGKLRPTHIVSVAVVLCKVDLKPGVKKIKHHTLGSNQPGSSWGDPFVNSSLQRGSSCLVFGGPVLMGMSVKVTEEVMGNNLVSNGSIHGEESPPPQSRAQWERVQLQVAKKRCFTKT